MTVLTIGLLVASASILNAQSRFFQGRVALDGGAAADIDFSTFGSSLPPTPALQTAISLRHADWLVRFEVSAPAMHENRFGPTEFRAGCGCVTGVDGPQSFTGLEAHRVSSYSFMTGREFLPAPRMMLTPVFGFSVVDHRDHEERSVVTLLPSGATTSESINTDRRDQQVAAIAGLDLGIALSPRLTLVPQVRWHTRGLYWNAIRPGVVLRVGF